LRSRRISSPCFRVSAGGLCPTALVAGDFKNPPISAAGPRHGPSRHETCCPSPASMRSATSQPCGHFGSVTPHTCHTRASRAPSPAAAARGKASFTEPDTIQLLTRRAARAGGSLRFLWRRIVGCAGDAARFHQTVSALA